MIRNIPAVINTAKPLGPSLPRKLWRQRYLLMMTVPFIIWAIAFQYLPLLGWSMAFQDFKLKANIIESFTNAPFVGLKHFNQLWFEFASHGRFYLALRNTLAMSLLSLTIGFIMPILFALFINELRRPMFKRVVQTVSYLPHFISWVVAAGMISTMLSSEGPVNNLLLFLGLAETRTPFLAVPHYFWGIITAADIWKEMGWNAIIFLAAITSIDPTLYESASIDGANRFHKMRYITLPSIMPVIIVILVMNIGWIVSIGFEKQFLLGSDLVRSYAEVLDTYVLNYGIGQGRYSFATAIGIFKSVVSIVLLMLANWLARRAGQESVL